MQRLEVSGAVRPLYGSLGFKGLNAFDVRPSCDTADVQATLPFPPNPPKHVSCDVPDCGVDALSQFW